MIELTSQFESINQSYETFHSSFEFVQEDLNSKISELREQLEKLETTRPYLNEWYQTGSSFYMHKDEQFENKQEP